VVCPNCGAANPSDGRFCLECGTSLAPGCPSCGAMNPSGAKFCGTCGTRLGPAEGAQALTPPASVTANGGAPAGDAGRGAPDEGSIAAATERRVVSVLFADLVAAVERSTRTASAARRAKGAGAVTTAIDRT
jgi:ribosomal protein L40E